MPDRMTPEKMADRIVINICEIKCQVVCRNIMYVLHRYDVRLNAKMNAAVGTTQSKYF